MYLMYYFTIIGQCKTINVQISRIFYTISYPEALIYILATSPGVNRQKCEIIRQRRLEIITKLQKVSLCCVNT